MDNLLGSGPARATDAAGSPIIQHRNIETQEMLPIEEAQRISLGVSIGTVMARRAGAAAAAAEARVRIEAKKQRVNNFRQIACNPISKSPMTKGQDLQEAHAGIAKYLGARDLASTHAVGPYRP